MSTRSILLASLVLTTANAVIAAPTAAAVQARDVIDHDAVVGFDETAPDTTEGSLMLAFKPLLKVVNGCVPFPAVDAEGNTRYVLGASYPPLHAQTIVVFISLSRNLDLRFAYI